MTEYKIIIENNDTKETKQVSVFGVNLATYKIGEIINNEYPNWSWIGTN